MSHLGAAVATIADVPQQIEPNDEIEPAHSEDVWFHLQRGDPQPAVDLFRLLKGIDCRASANGFLEDMAGRIVEASNNSA